MAKKDDNPYFKGRAVVLIPYVRQETAPLVFEWEQNGAVKTFTLNPDGPFFFKGTWTHVEIDPTMDPLTRIDLYNEFRWLRKMAHETNYISLFMPDSVQDAMLDAIKDAALNQ